MLHSTDLRSVMLCQQTLAEQFLQMLHTKNTLQLEGEKSSILQPKPLFVIILRYKSIQRQSNRAIHRTQIQPNAGGDPGKSNIVYETRVQHLAVVPSVN